MASAAIIAHWLELPALLKSVAAMPEVLTRATRISWPQAIDVVRASNSLFVLGRGPALPIATETALKLKETCAIHAEAYSVAEVMHGPLELLRPDFPVVIYAPEDLSSKTTREAVIKIGQSGAKVLVVGRNSLPFAETGNPLLDPVSMIQTSYGFIEQTALALGRNPDQPRLLKKITETV